MKKLITLLALCCLVVTGAWAQTVVATMQQLVGAASTTTATVSPFFTTSVTGGAVYSFTGNGGNSGSYIGGITNDAVDAAFTGSKVVTVAAWVYGRPNGCIFGYGDQNDGVKFLLSTSGTNTSFKTTTKGKLDFTSVNFTLQEDAWNLVAFSVYGKASSTDSYRYYYGTTNGNYSTKTDKTMSTMNAASKFAIGSGNQGSAREVFSSDIANLTIITSDGYLNNSNIVSLVGAAPTAVSHNYETYADGEFTYGPLTGDTWSAWSGSIPAELSALGSTYNATNLKVIEKYYTFAESGELDATFSHTSGNQRLDIAGIQVFSSTGVKIDADFHVGMAGTSSSGNGYSVFIPEGGSYIVRYISTANCGNQQNTNTNGKVANVFTAGSAPAFPVQDGKTYYIYNAATADQYLHPSGSGLALSTDCLEETAYMWTCVKNGAYYNFRNVATGKWLGFKAMSDNAYNFSLAKVANSDEYVTLFSVDQGKYMLVKNDGSKFDQSTLAENSGYSSKYGFTECSVSDLYFSESLASDKVKWLRAANCSNTGYVMTVKDDDTANSNLHTAGTDAAAEGQLFAFVGSQENGFVIYNKKLGNTYTLTAANTNEGTAATWVLNAETPTKWYLDESQLNASSQPGYGITTSSTSGGRSLNMWAGNGGDAKFYANGAGNGGSRWQLSLVDSEPTVIHYVVSGTKAHNDANNYVGVLKITKGTFASNTYVGTDVNGKTFNAYLPKTQEPISISNTNLHGWNYELTGSDGNYTVTYTAEQTDYQYLAFDESAQWYRIPAIAKAHNGDLVAIYDYRVCHNDVGFGEVDQVMRRSTDGGATWSAETKIADGNGGGNHFGAAYGDPALVADRESDNMTLITVSGQQSYPGATATSRPMVAALYSSDNGQHWSDPVDITSQFWGSKGAMFQDEDTEAASTTFAYSGFFGSGKILQSRITKVGSYYRLYAAMLCRGKNVSGAYVVYSDDMGRNWSLLGGNNTIKACSGSDEPKVEELPDGSIVLSGRKSYGRYFNIWTWMTKPTAANKAGEGFWGTDVQSNQQTNGISVGSNACNGEILLVDVKNSTTGQPAKLMLQSLPSGNDRSNVEIWYKDVTDDSAYSDVSTFASNWTKDLRVSNTSSAYSTMTEQADGRIGFFYEEGPATYCMVYVPLSISQITNNAYEKSVAPTPALSLETGSTVTSSQLSELTITFTGANAAQVQLSETKNKAYLTPKASTPVQVKAQNGKLKAAGETPAAIEGTITKDTNTDAKFNIAFEDEIPAGDYELSIPEGTFLVGTTPVPELTANYTVEEPAPALPPYADLPLTSGVYEIQNSPTMSGGNRGYLVDYTSYTNGPSLAECHYSGCENKHPNAKNDGSTTSSKWYVYNDNGTYYIVSLSTLGGKNTPQFLNPASPSTYSTEKVALTIAQHSSNTVQGSDGNTYHSNLISKSTSVYLSAACGTASTSGAVKTDTNGNDGGAPWVFIPCDESTLTTEQVALRDKAIEIIEIPTAGKVYTIKAHFTSDSYTDIYLTSDTGAEQLLLPMPTTATANQSYWVAEASGNTDRPWKFKSGYGYAKYLDWQNGGLSANGDNFGVLDCSTVHGTYHLNVSTNDRNIGTWGNNNDTKKGFGAVGSGGCWSQNKGHSNATATNYWTTDYEIVAVAGVTAYKVSCETTDGGVAPAFANYGGVATVKNGGYIIVPNGTTLDATNFPAAEISGYTGSVTFNGTTITVTYEATTTPDGFHIYESNGTYSNTESSSSYKDKWLSTDTDPQFTILVTGGGRATNNMYHSDTYADSGILCYTGNNSIGYTSTMTVSVQSGYKITGYTFKVKNLEGETSSHGKVVTTAGQTINTTAANQTVEVSGLNADNFTITLDGSTDSYNEGLVFTDFYVTYEEVELPTSYTYDVTINANGANVSSLTIDETVYAEGEATFNHEIQESDVTVTPVGGYSYTLNITQPNGTEHGTIVLTYTMIGVDVAVPGTYYVYLKNRDSQGHETYLYSDHGNFPGQTQEKASITSAEKLANELVWRLVSDGTNVTITNGQGFGYLPGDGAAEVKTVPVSNFNWITEKVTGYVQVVNINILYSKANDYGINGTYQAWNGGFFLFASHQTSFMTGSGNDQDGEFQTVIPSNVAWWTITETDQTFRSPNLRYDANEDIDEIHLTYTYFYQYETDQTFILSGLIAEAFENMDKVGYYSSEDVEMNQEVMEMWMSTFLYPDACMGPDGYYEMLDTFNEFCLSHEVITPQPGQAFRMSVRTVDCTKQMYLTDEGTLTDDPAKAAIFVAGSSSDGEGYNKIFASNNNSKLLYLNNTGATEGDYTEGTCDFKLVPMNTISDENGWFGAYNDPAHRFGTFYLEANNYEEEYSDNYPKALMMKENGDDSYELITGVKGARMLTASDDPDGWIDAPYSTAVKLEEVEYPYTQPSLASGKGDGHEGVWASVWLPFPMNIPDGIEVYKGTQERTVKGEPYLGLTKVDPDTHSCYAAGGYILYSTTVSAGPIDVLPANSVPTDARETKDAAFVGCTENPDIADDGTEWTAFSATFDGKTPYVLANKSNGIGFYKYVGTKMPKGKAIWLKPAASSDAECVKLGFDDIISAIEALHGNTANAEIYDLQGHRLDKVEKGQINVINGQKIMFK